MQPTVQDEAIVPSNTQERQGTPVEPRKADEPKRPSPDRGDIR